MQNERSGNRIEDLVNGFKNLFISAFFFPIEHVQQLGPQFFDPETRGIIKFLKENLPVHQTFSGKSLDIGSGRQPYADLIRAHGYKYESLDIVENTVTSTTYIADAADIPIGSNSFDLVTSFQVLEHLPYPELSVLEWNRVLKPGGTLLVTTAFYYPVHGFPADYFRFTKEGISEILLRNGFTNLKVFTRGNGLSYFVINAYYSLRRLQKKFLLRTSRQKTLLRKSIHWIISILLLMPTNIAFLVIMFPISFYEARRVCQAKYIGVSAIASKKVF